MNPQPEKRMIDHIIYGPGVHDCRVVLDDGSILDGVESINPHKVSTESLCKVDLTLIMLPKK